MRAKQSRRAAVRMGGHAFTDVVDAAHAAVMFAETAAEISVRCLDALDGVCEITPQERAELRGNAAKIQALVAEAKDHIAGWCTVVHSGSAAKEIR